jgi:hypothetical protein
VGYFQYHGSEFHQGNTLGLFGLQTPFADALFQAFLSYPTESILTRFGTP